jgi:DNA-binding NarL/FixJ family response regulator
MSKIKILLVDDHHIILDGIKLMIQDEPNIEISGIAENGKKALELISEIKPDVIITDISMPSMNGIQLIELIRERDNETKIIILSMYATEDYICRAIKAGANAYLTKQDTTKEEIIEAINSTINGDEYYSPAVSKIIMKNYVQKNQKNSGLVVKQNSLTNREKEILILYAEGFSNQEIADKLFISVRTVDAHKNNIMQKFNFKSTVDMVKFAIKNNLIDI